MEREIKRNNWSRFLRKFSADNQYRQTEITMKSPDGNPSKSPLEPFLGVTLTKNGRVIDGVQFLTGRADSDDVAAPALTIKEPAKIYLERDADDCDCRLRIEAKDGSALDVELRGEKETDRVFGLVRQVAYRLYENRGYTPGNDQGDWFEAEQRVRRAEDQVIA